LLNDIVKGEQVEMPSQILKKLCDGIERVLRNDDNDDEQVNGMEITMCYLDNTKSQAGGERKIVVASAGQAFYVVQNDEVQRIKGDISSIGFKQKNRNNDPFTDYIFTLDKETYLYMLSDGYVDQNGGDKDRKFLSTGFQDMIRDIYKQPMQKQSEIVADTFEKWMHPTGSIEENFQVDDVLVIGLKL